MSSAPVPSRVSLYPPHIVLSLLDAVPSRAYTRAPFSMRHLVALMSALPVLGACAFHAPPASNPILSDGADYTSDPAPFVAGGRLHILTGRDLAGPGVNDFVMPEWQMLEARGDPMSGRWTHAPHFLKPDDVFRWATPGRALASIAVGTSTCTRSTGEPTRSGRPR